MSAARGESPAVAPRHPLADVASILEATVSSTYEKYDPELGPRTYFVLPDMVTDAGATPDSSEFSRLGGKTPTGEEMRNRDGILRFVAPGITSRTAEAA